MSDKRRAIHFSADQITPVVFLLPFGCKKCRDFFWDTQQVTLAETVTVATVTQQLQSCHIPFTQNNSALTGQRLTITEGLSGSQIALSILLPSEEAKTNTWRDTGWRDRMDPFFWWINSCDLQKNKTPIRGDSWGKLSLRSKAPFSNVFRKPYSFTKQKNFLSPKGTVCGRFHLASTWWTWMSSICTHILVPGGNSCHLQSSSD